jgi:hypothetical protein
MSDTIENIKISISPLYHERQKRQFCAKHAINNLLQLPPQSSKGEHDPDFFDPVDQIILCRGKLYQHRAMVQVTVKECNLLADEITTKECHILSESGDMNNDGADDEKEEYVKTNNSNKWINDNDLDISSALTLWKRWTSDHRNIWTGNYSFNVLEAALLKRNVSLKFHKASGPIIEDMGLESCSNMITIGFIINSPSSYLSLGRHWYAITNVRRVEHISESGSLGSDCVYMDAKTGEPMEYNHDEWYVINSSNGNVLRLNDTSSLLDYLKAAEEHGCTILKASMEYLVLLDGDVSGNDNPSLVQDGLP